MKHLFIIILLSVSALAFGQRENMLPLKASSAATDTIRVVKDNQSALMLRSVLQGAIYDSLSTHTDTLQALRADIDAGGSVDVMDSIAVHRTELDNLHDSIDDHRIDIDANLDSIAMHRAELDNLSDSITDHRTDIDSNTSTGVNNAVNISSNSVLILGNTNDISSLEDSISKHTDTLQLHQVKIDALYDTAAIHLDTLELHQDQISTFNSFYNNQTGEFTFIDTTYIVYVDLSGSDDTGSGTEGNPYYSVRKAVESVDGYAFSGGVGGLIIKLGLGTYQAKDVFPYLNRANIKDAMVMVVGTPIVGDTVNVTHPGTATQSYFRFTTDSTLAGDLSRTFLGVAINPANGAAACYPIESNTSSTFISPANSSLVGDNRFLVTLGTAIETDADYGTPGLDNWVYFSNIEFKQTEEQAAYNFTTSKTLSFVSCKFTSDYVAYDQLGIMGNGTILLCIIEHEPSASSGDALEFNGGGENTVAYSILYSSTARTVGSQGLEVRPGSVVDAYIVILDGFDEAIKDDGNAPLGLGALYFKNSNTAIHCHDPRRQYITETEESWAAGTDSIICEDVLSLFNFSDSYDAGRDVYLPHLKAGGYTSFNGDIRAYPNNTLDLENLSAIAVGDGIRKVIVDTVDTENLNLLDLPSGKQASQLYFDESTGLVSYGDTVQGGISSADSSWTSIEVDSIFEYTTDNGVDIEGVHFEGSNIKMGENRIYWHDDDRTYFRAYSENTVELVSDADMKLAVSEAGTAFGDDIAFSGTVDIGKASTRVDDLFVSKINQALISAALTDGAPTDAQIDSAVGFTPAQVGAGFKVMILDTDGTELIYIVVSDGTTWQYTALTIAL